jgi:branched-subunit amino acid aminotransferase/4-amino-4-deoxychorismate lyase
VSERSFAPGELVAADEVFLCGTGYDIAPVVEIDGRQIGDGGPRPVTDVIVERYEADKRTGDVTPIGIE